MAQQPTNVQDILNQWPVTRVQDAIYGSDSRRVRRALAEDTVSPEGLAALLSPAAHDVLEEMAQRAHRDTSRYFGRMVALYVPLYVSNICQADCVYCGFGCRSGNTGPRMTLAEPEIHAECRALVDQGFCNLLLVTGEAPNIITVEYLVRAVTIARSYFPSVSIEIHTLDTDGYEQLCAAGLEGVTLYMETYDRSTYATMHRLGKKRDYDYRVAALERAGLAGARRLNLGCLLGLFDWRIDAFWTCLHARYLQRVCWQSAVNISFPRLRNVPDGFAVPHPVNDAQLVQYMLAARLFLPQAGFTLSTREPAELRDHLVPLGVTLMSAGSSTRPGGYTRVGDSIEQFEIEDTRSPAEVASMLAQKGYDPVWKDFDQAFHEEVTTS